MTVTVELQRTDFDEVAGKLASGLWMAYPYEAYGQLDRDEWNDQLVKHLERRDVQAEVIDLRKKSVVIVVNAAALPTLDQVKGTVAAIEHMRSLRRL